jgi:hypothetical protein
VKESAVLRTESGRAEILLGPCTWLRVADNSSIRMVNSRLLETRVDLLGGSVVVDAVRVATNATLTLLVNHVAVVIANAGMYRVDFAPPRLKVASGKAAAGPANQAVPSGTAVALDPMALPEKFDKRSSDAFDTWNKSRFDFLAKERARYPDRRTQSLMAASTTAATTDAIPERGADYPRYDKYGPPPPIFANPSISGANAGCLGMR